MKTPAAAPQAARRGGGIALFRALRASGIGESRRYLGVACRSVSGVHRVGISRLARLVAAAVWGAGLAFAPPSALGAGDAAPSSAALRVVSDDNYPPYIFRDASGELQGILPDSWALWQKKTGIRVEFEAMDWGLAQRAMLEHKADVIDTIFRTPLREQVYGFTRPYAALDVAIFFDRDLAGITDLRTARGFTIGAKDGDACVEYLNAAGVASIRLFPSYEDLVAQAGLKHVSVFCMDVPPALYLLSRAGLASEFRRTAPIYTGEFHRAVRKEDAALLQRVQAGFDAITADEREAIEQKWRGAAIVDQLRSSRSVLYALVAVIGGGLTLLLWNHALRRRVAARTSELASTLAALRETEDLYRTVVKASPDGITLSDLDGRITYLSDRIVEFLRLERPEDALGKSVVDYFAPADRARALAAIGAIRRGSRRDGLAFTMLRADGTTFTGEVSASLLFDSEGRPRGIVGITRDISEWKAAADALRLHSAALEHSLNGFVIVDAGGNFVYANRAYLAMWGYATVDEIIGTSTIGHCVDAAEPEKIIAALRHADADAREFIARRKDGSTFAVMMSSRRFAGEDGRELFISTALDVTQRREHEAQLRRSEERYRTLFDATGAGMVLTDAQMRILLANGKAAAMAGLPAEAMIGRNYLEFVHPDERERLQSLQQARNDPHAGDLPHELEIHYLDGHGTAGWCLVSVARVPGTGELITSIIDITARKQAEDSLRQAAVVYESTAEGVLIADIDGRILGVNRAFTEITGYAKEEALGRTPAILRSGRHDAVFYEEMWRRLLAGETWQGEIWNRRKSGEIYPEWLTISGVRDPAGRLATFVAVFSDIGPLKRSAEQMYHLAHYDALTDLPNRTLFNTRIAHALEVARRHERKLALLFLDVDRFKNVNDSLGHPIGDELLLRIAQRLRARLRAEDTLARLGGDEFAILMESIDRAEDAAALAQSILDNLAAPFALSGGREVYATVSIGIALYPGSAPQANQLIRDADAAMYKAKEGGRNTFRLYTENLTRMARERLDLEANLRRSLVNGEFLLEYQPQVRLADGALVGFEALVRWESPLGRISPDGFIPVAEDTGLIVPLGEWVSRAACRQARLWLDQGRRRFTMAINLSPRQFRQPDLVGSVRRILAETGLPGEVLELEITESAITESPDEAIVTLRRLKALGLRIAIDDFGTGYSSLAALKRFPIDTLKIDRSFVAGLGEDADDREIVSAIIAMGRNMGMVVMAEGVETVAQRDFLASHGCELAQGYFYARPLTIEQAAGWLAESSSGKVSREIA
jgi:diguanylate cyclase (GGDEF)-like protein/PAS domain S-box-containing protein